VWLPISEFAAKVSRADLGILARVMYDYAVSTDQLQVHHNTQVMMMVMMMMMMIQVLSIAANATHQGTRCCIQALGTNTPRDNSRPAMGRPAR
jgi:hypothetical protein